jgi:hypothetical protein
MPFWPFPNLAEDDPEPSEDEPATSDIPFYLEEGDCKGTFNGLPSLAVRFTYFHLSTFVFPVYGTCYTPRR